MLCGMMVTCRTPGTGAGSHLLVEGGTGVRRVRVSRVVRRSTLSVVCRSRCIRSDSSRGAAAASGAGDGGETERARDRADTGSGADAPSSGLDLSPNTDSQRSPLPGLGAG